MFDPSALDTITACYHEAGHAMIAHWIGGTVLMCTIETEDDTLGGRTSVEWRGLSTAERRRCSALVALGGPIAEAHHRRDLDLLESSAAWEADWREIATALAAQPPSSRREQTLRGWIAEVARQLEDPNQWERLCRVADALAAHETIDRALFLDAISD